MTAEDKKKVLAVLDGMIEDSSGVVRATIMACKCAFDEMEVEEKWIPVAERLPEEFISVIVSIPSEHPLPTVKEAYLANGCWVTKMAIFSSNDITHWMPLPEPPKEGAK